MMGELRQLIQERNRSDKEGVGDVVVRTKQQFIDELKKYVGIGYMTFTTEDKVGINPQSNFKTPLGIYTYPITDEILKKLINKRSRAKFFATERDYVQVIKPRNPSRILKLNDVTETDATQLLNKINDLLNLPPCDYEQHKREIIEKEMMNVKRQIEDGTLPDYLDVDDKVNLARLKKYLGTPTRVFWNGVRLKSKNPTNWNKLFRDIGIDGVDDEGSGTIHPNEPTQAVFFSRSAIEHVDAFKNKLQSEIEKNEDTIGFTESSVDLRKMYNKFLFFEKEQYSLHKSKKKSSAIERTLNNFARNSNTPKDVLFKLLERDDKEIDRALILNDNLPVEIFKTILTRYDQYDFSIYFKKIIWDKLQNYPDLIEDFPDIVKTLADELIAF